MPKCLLCESENDAQTGMHGAVMPHAGDISICIYCGNIAEFGDDCVTLVPIEKQKLSEVMEEDHIKRAMLFISLLSERKIREGNERWIVAKKKREESQKETSMTDSWKYENFRWN